MGLQSTLRGGANNGATLNWPALARNASSSWLRRSGGDGGGGARPRPQPRAAASPTRAAGAASCCPRGVGAPVVGAARLRVAARLGLDAAGRLLARTGAAYRRRARAARVGPGARRGGAARQATLARVMCAAPDFSDAGTADAARKSARKQKK